MKQGRNEPCKCGSNEKYKNCCERKEKETIITLPSQKIIKRQLTQLEDLVGVFSDEVLLENFKKSTKLRYVVSIDKLPLVIKEKIINLSKIIEPKNGKCETYSQFISLNIPEVKQVRGFFQFPYTKELKEEFIKRRYNVEKVEYDRVYSDKIYKDVLDINGEVWSTHSWNEYNGIHFDCLKDYLNWNEDGEWYDYRISKSHNLNQIVSKGVIEQYINPGFKNYFLNS
jgi:hypothetical protein